MPDNPPNASLLKGQDLNRAANLLREGRLVGIPTETVYGLAANALDEAALKAVFTAKNRPYNDPLIVHIADAERVGEIASEFPDAARRLAEAFWPGPLTLLLPRAAGVPDLVTAGLPAVAIRVPSHPLTLELLRLLEFPVAAPSANPFGYVSPTTAEHVLDQLGDAVAYVLDGGPCTVGVESTIVGFDGPTPVIYRLGGLGVDQIVRVAGRVQVQQQPGEHPVAPGSLASHYAPRTPVVLGAPSLEGRPPETIGALSLNAHYDGLPAENQVQLSRVGDFSEAARNLYSALRYLDGLDLAVIYAELLPETGLGLAINDRLRRAAAARE